MIAAVLLVEMLWKGGGWGYPEGQGAGQCVQHSNAVGELCCRPHLHSCVR